MKHDHLFHKAGLGDQTGVWKVSFDTDSDIDTEYRKKGESSNKGRKEKPWGAQMLSV